MSKLTIDILQTLLAGGDNQEHVLEESRDFWDDDWDYDEMEAIFDALVLKWEKLVSEIAAVWGSPMQAGSGDEVDFPWSVLGNRIAVWPHDDRFAYAAVRHEDKELPMLLLLGVSDGLLG
jgi:hypothetical protein